MTRFSRDYIKNLLDNIRDDYSEAKWAIIFIIAYFVFMNKFSYSSCPVVLVTGYPGPGCGMTRAGISLLHFQFKEALKMNPFIYWWALFVMIFVIRRYLLLRKSLKWLKWMGIIGLIGMILFYVWRMIMCFPGEPPMVYYEENMITRIIEVLKCIRE